MKNFFGVMTIAALALLSGLGEEVFFRGARRYLEWLYVYDGHCRRL